MWSPLTHSAKCQCDSAHCCERSEDNGRLVLTDEPNNIPIAGHVTGGALRDLAVLDPLAETHDLRRPDLLLIGAGGVILTILDVVEKDGDVSAAAGRVMQRVQQGRKLFDR